MNDMYYLVYVEIPEDGPSEVDDAFIGWTQNIGVATLRANVLRASIVSDAPIRMEELRGESNLKRRMTQLYSDVFRYHVLSDYYLMIISSSHLTVDSKNMSIVCTANEECEAWDMVSDIDYLFYQFSREAARIYLTTFYMRGSELIQTIRKCSKRISDYYMLYKLRLEFSEDIEQVSFGHPMSDDFETVRTYFQSEYGLDLCNVDDMESVFMGVYDSVRLLYNYSTLSDLTIATKNHLE